MQVLESQKDYTPRHPPWYRRFNLYLWHFALYDAS